MQIKVHINDDEVKAFFEANGYECKVVESGYWSKEHHNRCEWIECDKLVVIVHEQQVSAHDLIQATIKQRLLSAGATAKNAIKTALKTL